MNISTELFNAVNFLANTEGTWVSQRRYFDFKSKVLRDFPDNFYEIKTDIQIDKMYKEEKIYQKIVDIHKLNIDDCLYGVIIYWDSYNLTTKKQSTQGTMSIVIDDKYVYRDREYSTTSPVISSYTSTTPTCITMMTEYNDTNYTETINLFGEVRTRQTVAKKDNEIILIGQYVEQRVTPYI
jgi:hypothetical protein